MPKSLAPPRLSGSGTLAPFRHNASEIIPVILVARFTHDIA